jgi:hypothetical protein
MADRNAGRGQPWREMANQFDRVNIDGGGRQAVADDDRKLIGPAAAVGKLAPGGRVEYAAEVGTAEIIAPATRLAGKQNRLQAEATQSGNDPRMIEGGVNGVARPRVVEGKAEQRCGRQARARPAEPDPGRRQLAQKFKRTG